MVKDQDRINGDVSKCCWEGDGGECQLARISGWGSSQKGLQIAEYGHRWIMDLGRGPFRFSELENGEGIVKSWL